MTSEIKLSSKSARKPNTRQTQKGKEEKYKTNMSSDDDTIADITGVKNKKSKKVTKKITKSKK